tara:strand:+ start:48 stop:371 length:324 start_codon:yes stop_codon:yes gene_type:complete
MKIEIKNSQAKNKRFVAVFTDDKGKTQAIRPQGKKVNFGLKNPKIGTYIDHGDKVMRKNYIARHEATEKKFYSDPMRPATLSRFILWGDSSSLKQNIESYKKKFNLE